MAETSTKPYMIRALYEWCCDNSYTPYLAVAVDEHTIVPMQHVQAGQIVLNVSPMATSRLTLGNELVEFQARFSGVAQQISIPIGNISAIYARETGHGMAFDVAGPADAAGDDAAVGHEDRGGGEAGGDHSPDHSPGSSVHSLRGGARRRGPRSIDINDGQDVGAVEQADDAGPGDQAANSRKRAAKGQGSADVLEFAPSGGAGKKKGGTSRGKGEDAVEGPASADDKPGDDGEEPPPADGGGGGGKGGKARLTRVK